MQQYLDKLTSKQALSYIKQGEAVFQKAPHLPAGLRSFLVTIAPWLTIIGAFFAALGAVSNLASVVGGSTVMRMYAWYATAPSLYFLLTAVIQALTAVLLFKAFKPLQDQSFVGWVFLFWNMVLCVISSLIPVLFGYHTSVVSVLIGALIGFYILYEMKPEYSSK